MRRRRDCIGALRNHTGTGYVPNDLSAWKMTADSRFCALSHFDFNGSAGLQIILVYAESPGSHLDDSVVSVAVKIFMQTAFSCIIKDTELLSGDCQ